MSKEDLRDSLKYMQTPKYKSSTHFYQIHILSTKKWVFRKMFETFTLKSIRHKRDILC